MFDKDAFKNKFCTKPHFKINAVFIYYPSPSQSNAL